MTITQKLHNSRQLLLASLPRSVQIRVVAALKAAKKSGDLSLQGWEKIVADARYTLRPTMPKKKWEESEEISLR